MRRRKEKKEPPIQFVPAQAEKIAPIFTPPTKKALAEARLRDLAEHLQNLSDDELDLETTESEGKLLNGDMEDVSLKEADDEVPPASEAESDDEDEESSGDENEDEEPVDDIDPSEESSPEDEESSQDMENEESEADTTGDEGEDDDESTKQLELAPVETQQEQKAPDPNLHALVPVAAATGEQSITLRNSAMSKR